MPYPAARENPESTPCVRKFRGSSEGVREAAKNRVPRRRPLVENECHGPLPIWPHLSIPGERQLRPAACRERPDGTSRGREIESIPSPADPASELHAHGCSGGPIVLPDTGSTQTRWSPTPLTPIAALTFFAVRVYDLERGPPLAI